MTTGQIFRGTIVILLTLVGAYVLIVSVQILIVLLMAVIIASAIRPIVTTMTNRGIPMTMAVVMVYFVLAAVMILLLVVVMPPIVNQVTQYMENDDRLASRIILAQKWAERSLSDMTNEEVSLVRTEQIRTAVSEFVTQIRDTMPTLLDDIGTTLSEAVLIFVMGAYWLTSHEKATNFITQSSPPRHREKAQILINQIENTMGNYVRGIVLISTIVGILNFSAMQLVGIPNAVSLAFIAAITTIVPMIGGLVGAILAVLVTLVAAPQYVPGVIVITFIVQQIEAYYLGPRIVSDQVGLDPLLVIVYTSVGFVMFGIVGALIAVPVMGTIHILLVHLVIEPHKQEMHHLQTEGGLPMIRETHIRHGFYSPSGND